jgi:FdhD protein
MSERSPVVDHHALQWRDGQANPIVRALAEEVAVAITYDGQAHAVLMATPADLGDLAVGFTLSEGIAAFADLGAVTVTEAADGMVADVTLSAKARAGLVSARERTMASRTSCGLCGATSLEEAVRPLPRLDSGPSVTPQALQRALTALEGEQTLGRTTRATHAAAWAGADGALRLVREDVGRHNALDKLIGAAARAGLDPSQAFIVVTSRCSYEMVEKAALAGVSVLVAISAPTALAIRKAQEANMTLVALARADGHMAFTGGERLIGPMAEAAE